MRRFVFILLCGFIGFVGYRIGIVHAPTTQARALRLGRDEWTNPLLACSTADQKDEALLGVLATRWRAIIQNEQRASHVSQVSVYMRDLENGKTMGLGENDLYASASLMKLPILLAYLKKAEVDPGILNQTLNYNGSFDLDQQQNVKPSETLQKGDYKIEELLRHMIVYSANNAMVLLAGQIKEEGLRKIYDDLKIPFEFNQDQDLLISPKNYALFFRTLYSATYLSREMSEKALRYLNQVEFKQGIVAGVPETVRVAHKFGERVLKAQDGTSNAQLHDCGIVYHEKHPYVLCIMTQGQALESLTQVISQISSTTYAFMDKEYKP